MKILDRFSNRLISCNGLQGAGFVRWLFRPGMRFNDLQKWWGDEGPRIRPHEGTDFYCFADRNGRTHSLAAGTAIPAISGGEIIAVFDDLIGHSILVLHKTGRNGLFLHSLYAHTLPEKPLGSSVQEGEVIALLASSTRFGAPPPHLHLSILRTSEGINRATDLNWRTISGPLSASLIDPLDFCDAPPSPAEK